MENNAENGTVTSPAVAAEPLTAAIVVKRLQRGTVTLARNDIKCCFTVRVLMPEQLAEYTWTADRVERWMELPLSKRSVPKSTKNLHSTIWSAGSRQSWLQKDWHRNVHTAGHDAPRKDTRGKLFQQSLNYLYFVFGFIKPEFISMHHGRWWGCARYICTYSWTRNKILWLCEAFHLEA